MEKFCATEGFRHAFIRGSLGSLIDACLAGRNPVLMTFELTLEEWLPEQD